MTGSVRPAGASTFQVTSTDDSGPGTLRQAIIDANANGPGLDQITFEPYASGTIDLASNLPTITSAVDIQGPDKYTSFYGSYYALAIDGGGEFHAFELQHSGASTISGLTITGSTVNHANPDESGGAIALFDAPGSLTVHNVTIRKNRAFNDGGGIDCRNSGGLTIEESRITGNQAQGGGGGALYASSCGTVTIADTTIDQNQADDGGGGLYLADSELVVRSSTISGSTAGKVGGGAKVANTGAQAADLTNMTISGNTSTGKGGAIFVADGELTLTQTTVTGNTGASVGGIYTAQAGALSTDDAGKAPDERRAPPISTQAVDDLGLVGTIVAANDGTDLAGSSGTGIVSSTASLLGTVDPATVVHDQGGTLTGVDPKLGPLTFNGGLTQTHAFAGDSPAIDAGPNPAPVFPGSEFDQRGDGSDGFSFFPGPAPPPGFARVVNGVVDIGAYEEQRSRVDFNGPCLYAVSTSDGVITHLVQVPLPPAPPPPPDRFFDCGLIDFDITHMTPGGEATITVSVFAVNGRVKEFWKLEGGRWTQVSNATITQDSGTPFATITFAIRDGGPLDADGAPNGRITDPSGPAVERFVSTVTPTFTG